MTQDDDIQDAINYPDVRNFMVAQETSNDPLFDLIAIQRSWTVPTDSKHNAGSMTLFVIGRWVHWSPGASKAYS